MPTYRYKCPNGHELEEFQSINAATSRPCQKCCGPELFSAVTAHFGSGIMETEDLDRVVWMQRQISGGAGVIWKEGAPTPNFAAQRRRRRF